MTHDSAFDVNSIMNETMAAPLDTERAVVPDGEYIFQVGTGEKDIDITMGVVKKEGPNKGKPWARLSVMCDIPDPNLAAQLSVEKIRVRHDVMLDVTLAGKLDFGPQRNIKLGKFMAACGLNAAGAGIPQLRGRSFKGKVVTKKEEGFDPRNEIVLMSPAV